MQPLDTEFCKLLQEFEPRYTLPDRSTIATHYLPLMFENEKKHIKEAMGSVMHYAVTPDLQTSRAKHAYTGMTVHYISGDFSLQSHLLETKEFPDNHIATSIAEKLDAIL